MTIAEVSRKYGLSPDTLRYYERIGLLPKVGRTPGGKRDYTEENCKWVEFIRCMRAAGVQIEALCAYVALFARGDGTAEERKQILIEQRDRLAKRIGQLKESLALLNRKIEDYEQVILPKEKALKRQGD